MSSEPKRVQVLFLCTGNSCRSQMAEGLCRHLHSETMEASSAGTVAHGLNPLAVQVMDEIGIDIRGHWSKTVADIKDRSFDFVVTVCDRARESCPYFPASVRVMHRSFDDPPALARQAASEDALAEYRRVRDEIRDFILSLPEVFGEERRLPS